jgi:hypothetical protein
VNYFLAKIAEKSKNILAKSNSVNSMKPNLFLYSAVLSVCGAALHPAGQNLVAAEIETPSLTVSQAAAGPYGQLPIDLARGSVGTRLQVLGPKTAPTPGADQDSRSAQALISDDSSLAYPLAPGETSFILTLPKIEVLSRFNFISYEAAGQVAISVSSTKLPADSPEWRPVARSHKFGADEVAACPLGSVEARYVKIDFKTQNTGRIASFGLFGLPTISNFKVQPLNFNYVSGAATPQGSSSTQNNNVYFDYANLYTGASVVAVSSGGQLDKAQAMIDGNSETSYAFDPADPTPTVVIDLGVRRSLNRLSCVYQAPAGRMDVYLVDNPGNAGGFQRVSLNYISAPQTGVDAASAPASEQSNLPKRKALISVDTTGQPGFGRISADLGGQSGRFLIAAFHPVASTPSPVDFKDFKDSPRDFKDFKDSPRDFKDVAQPQQSRQTSVGGTPGGAPNSTPFRVLAFSAFGDVPSGNSVLRQTPPVNNPGGGGGGGTTVPNQPPFPEPPQGGGIITP